MSIGFKRKDWMAVAIGTLTLLIAAGGIFMPDWVKADRLTDREAYSILGALAAVIVVCLVVQQIDLRSAEAPCSRVRQSCKRQSRPESEWREISDRALALRWEIRCWVLRSTRCAESFQDFT
jgi:hypothetical protein